METILIIEDDELIRENMSELFTNEGYQVFTANNGNAGIKQVKKNTPDIIFSDIMMPEMDGFQVYKELRADPQFSVIPFIFLSALSDKSNIRFGMRLGADDYITKPFVNSELLEVARNRIAKSKLSKKSMEELKLSLINSVPHEFMTPLNAVMGFSQILTEGLKDEKGLSKEDIIEFSEYIYSAGKDLLRLTQNYVLYSELNLIGEENKLKRIFRSEISTELEFFLNDFSYDIARTKNREKDLIVKFENATLSIGEKNLKKIAEELLSNSLKFSEENTNIYMEGFKDKNFYILRITDHGLGMSTEEIQKIQSFMQFNRKTAEQAGLGLGLSLVLKILELIGGKFKIESDKHKGTRINVSIPLSSHGN